MIKYKTTHKYAFYLYANKKKKYIRNCKINRLLTPLIIKNNYELQLVILDLLIKNFRLNLPLFWYIVLAK